MLVKLLKYDLKYMLKNMIIFYRQYPKIKVTI